MSAGVDPRDSRADDASSPSDFAEASAPPRRSPWRISLGGVLLFAAGLMIGFAPMRTWIFLRDEPEYLAIEVIVAEVDQADDEALRASVRAGTADSDPHDEDGPYDPETFLRSTSGAKVISQPTIMTLVDQPCAIIVGGAVPVVTSVGNVAAPRTFGFEAEFTPRVRRSGSIELEYSISESAFRDDATGEAMSHQETTVASSIVLKPGEWMAVPLKSPTPELIEGKRSRWLFFRTETYEP